MEEQGGRKRTTVACSLCRKRKRRCDRGSPSCKLCTELDSECIYPEAETQRSKEERLLDPLVNRLDFLQETLSLQTRMLEGLSDRIQDLESASNVTASPRVHVRPFPSAASPQSIGVLSSTPNGSSPQYANGRQAQLRPESISSSVMDGEVRNALPPMSIPIRHWTTTTFVLSLDVVKAILGEFPEDIFLRAEEERQFPLELQLNGPRVDLNDLPVVNFVYAEILLNQYFEHVHGEAPILNQAEFYDLHQRLKQDGLSLDSESALYLAVLALGCVSQQDVMPNMENLPGTQFLTPALRILLDEYIASYGSSFSLSQGLFLVGRYFSFTLCPLQSWKLVHMASTNLQHYLLKKSQTHQQSELTSQAQLTAWAIFDAECDLIAEHHLPRSGIENVIDGMALPSSHTCGDLESHAMLNWLAELSVRRLLNRVHHAMYGDGAVRIPRDDAPSERSQSVLSMLKVSIELDQQLDTWFQMLPPTIRPDIGQLQSQNASKLHLLHRYHSAKEIISRPFLFHVSSFPEHQPVDDIVLKRCEDCLQNCRSYLAVAEERLRFPCASREIFMHSIFSSTITLTVGFLSTTLTSLVEDIDVLQKMALTSLERFASPGSSVETMFWILQSLQSKTRILGKSKRR